MIVEEELITEVPTKIGSNWKGNYQNKDRKASNFKEVHTVNHYTEYTPIGTAYT